MRHTAFLSLVIAVLPSIALAQAAPAAEWEPLKQVYKERANLEKHKQAASMAQELAAKYPGDKEAAIFCAMTSYYTAHRLPAKQKKEVALKGVECTKRVLEKDKTDYDARYWWAMTKFKSKEAEGINAALKQAAQVKAYLEKMIKDQPNRGEGYMMLGVLYRDLPGVISWGDPKKGLELLQKANSLLPKDPEVLLELAAAYAKVGNKDEARKAYNECINDSKAPRNKDWETEDAKAYAKKMLKDL